MNFCIQQVPKSEEEWMVEVTGFKEKWNYPACVGAVDGKHIAIRRPDRSGSDYYNYKHYYSVILLAVVNAHYKFSYVNVGAPGRAGDAGVFANSSLKSHLDEGSLNLPDAIPLEGIETTTPVHFIGDDAFPLSMRMMKPYPHRNLDNDKRIFNYRLSRARRVVENAFGILAHRFRVFLTTINLNPDAVKDIVMAAVCLHNFLIENKNGYCNLQDSEETETNDQMLPLSATFDRNPTNDAKNVRSQLTEFFVSAAGSVAWQRDYIA